MRRVRIFVSSPGDVAHERRRVDRVLERLNGEFVGVAHLEAIRWETEFYRAHATFQAQIPAAAECDIVVAIFRARLGTELPPDFERTPDGTPYPSGTAYEVLSAIAARQKGDLPDVYVFRYPEPPTVRLDDPEAARIEEQWRRLKNFFDTWFAAAQGPFKAAFHTYGSIDDLEDQLDRLLRGWLEDNVLRGRAVLWPIPTKGSPFRGLAAFGTKHAPVFFGRSRDIARAVDRWKDAAERRTAFLLVVGASGSGKSSLARAGVVPRLTVSGVVPEVDLWRVAVMRPSEISGGPLASLATRLLDADQDIPEAEAGRPAALPELASSDYRTPAELAELLHHADATALAPLLRALDRIGEAARRSEGYDRSVRVDFVLLVDQLDELFAADVPEEERQRFAHLLRLFAESRRIWVVATLRAELYERFLAEPNLLALKTQGTAYDLAPPGPAELAEIVRKPAEAADLQFEKDPASGEGLDERLLREADRPDMLPLLQLALNRLFEARTVSAGETRMSFAAYEALGGLAGIIDREAERAFATVGETEQTRLPRLLRRLVTAAPGVAGVTIRTVPLANAAPDDAARRLVDALVAGRILLISGEGAAAGVQIAHQRVLADWQRACELITADQDFYRIRDEVEAQRRRWQSAGGSRDLLIPSGLPLAEAEAIAARFGDELAPESRAFIAASSRRVHLRQRLVAVAAVVFALLALGATGAGLVAWHERQQAVKQQTLAERNLAAAKQAVHFLTFDIAQGLRNVEGIRAATIRKVLERVEVTIDKLSQDAPNDLDLLRTRAAMFDEFAQTYIAVGDVANARRADAIALDLMRTLVAREPGNAKDQGNLTIVLNRNAGMKLRAGDGARALVLYQESVDILRKLTVQNPKNPAFRRDLAVSLESIGDVRLRLGDGAAALAAYREGLEIHRQLADAEPAKAEWQRDIAISLGRIADVTLETGNARAVLATYQEALAIVRRLAKKDPGNSEWQRDVAAGLESVADAELRVGDTAAASAALDEALAVHRRLVKQDPDRADWQRDLAVGLLHYGDMQLRTGSPSAALASYEEALAIDRRLAQRSPDSLDAQRDVSVVLERMGDAYSASDAEQAPAAFREALAIRRKLLAADPQNLEFQRDVSIGLERVSEADSQAGHADAALAAAEEALKIARDLSRRDPGNRDRRHDVSAALERIGDLKLKAGDLAGDLAAYDEERSILAALSEQAPDNEDLQQDLSVSLEKIARLKRRSGDSGAALADFAKVRELRRAIVARDPRNIEAQRNLVLVLNTIGDLQAGRKDVAAAHVAYDEAIALLRPLAARPDVGPVWRQMLAAELDKAGNLDLAGAAAAALAEFREKLDVDRALLKAEATNTTLRLDIAVTLDTIGDLSRQTQDTAGALGAYQEAVATLRGLTAAPGDGSVQRQLAVELNKLGDVRLGRGDATAAIATYQDALATMRGLVKRDPGKKLWQADLAYTQARLSLAQLRAGDKSDAVAADAEAFAVRRRLADAAPADVELQKQAMFTAIALASGRQLLGDKGGAVAAYREALTLAKRLAALKPDDAQWQIAEIIVLGKIAAAATDPDRHDALTEALAMAERLAQAGKLSSEQQKWPELIRKQLTPTQ